jgi:predicted GH43/DUF377 family glycosyl hydrolase
LYQIIFKKEIVNFIKRKSSGQNILLLSFGFFSIYNEGTRPGLKTGFFMLRIFKLLKKLKPNYQISLFIYEQKVYLIATSPDSAPKMAVSTDGFDFKSLPYQPTVAAAGQQLGQKQQSTNGLYRYLHISGSENLDPQNLHIQQVFFDVQEILVFYDYQYHLGELEVGVAAYDRSHSHQLIWRSPAPIWQSPEAWKGQEVTFVNLVRLNNRLISYWLVKNQGLFALVYPGFKVRERLEVKRQYQLPKYRHNPILKPQTNHDWEAFNTFNAGALYEADQVHILYRAQGFDYTSSIGYAASNDGYTITERLDQPIFLPTRPKEKQTKVRHVRMDYYSGSLCGGCEDPRLTRLGDRIFMTYVAYDGWTEPRIALTSISVRNFLDRQWLWTKPVLISPPGIVDKSACLLPEKINGQYVIFHRVFPNILVDFIDNLDFTGDHYLKGQYKISPRSPLWWDSRKIGPGAPPLKTKDGWLLIYQAVDDKDASHYKVGAMLLDLNNPARELYRSRYPIIEPDQWYEYHGFKAGVVYPCGAVIIDETLFVYYGAADSYVAVATAPLNRFLDQLKSSSKVALEATDLSLLS